MPLRAAPALQYRAGPKALERIRSGGFGPRDLRAFILPATGPRWLIATGFDRALLAHGWLNQSEHCLLMLGASAGAWRALALAARDPETTYAALIERYIEQHFTFADDPHAISAAYRMLLSGVFTREAMQHAVAHETLDLAIIAARVRSSERLALRREQQLVLGAAALSNFVSTRSSAWFFERTLFHSREGRGDAHEVAAALRGVRIPLTVDNVHAAALASGSVPLYMQPVTDIAGATPGAYLDGGLTDYHLGQTLELPRGIALMFLHQPKVIAAWLDQYVPWRRTDPQTLANVLLVHPSPAFVASLPGGKVPSRHDFKTFVNEPNTRFAHWRRAVELSTALGEAFLEDVASGRIAERAAPL